MTDNLEYWNKLARPPASAMKAITGGRMSGKSSIDPQWRYKRMTEVYGPCGEGWKFEIQRMWTEDGEKGQVFAFTAILLSVNTGDGWSEWVPGVGGSMLLKKESAGLHHNDEAFKMSLTDALSVAMKLIGVGADVYLGLFDGDKYKTPPPTIAVSPVNLETAIKVAKKAVEKAPPKVDAKLIPLTFKKDTDELKRRVGEKEYDSAMAGFNCTTRKQMSDSKMQVEFKDMLTKIANKYDKIWGDKLDAKIVEWGSGGDHLEEMTKSFNIFCASFLKDQKIKVPKGKRARNSIMYFKQRELFWTEWEKIENTLNGLAK